MSNYFDVKRDVIEYTKERHGRIPNLIFCVGQRGAGKTHSALKECLINTIEKGRKFVYVRRWTTEIGNRDMNTVFTDVIQDPEVVEAIRKTDLEGYDRYAVLARSGMFWLCGLTGANTIEWLIQVGTITCVSMAEQFKGGTYSDYNRGIFDEFITERGYINGDREVEHFLKIVYTLGRKPTGAAGKSVSKEVIFYLCGNPDASIEGCPYLYSLHLDYARLQPNIPYYFERYNGQISAFIKIARDMGNEYLDDSVVGMFDNPENTMSITGEVKEYSYIKFNRDIMEMFKPHYKLIVETPVITKTEYHKILYVYYGYITPPRGYEEACCVILGHDIIKCDTQLYCRYDADIFKPHQCPQTWRFNIPQRDIFSDLRMLIAHVDTNRLIFTSENRFATLVDNIRKNS